MVELKRGPFFVGQRVRLTASGLESLEARSTRGYRPPNSDPRRGVVVGFSPRHPDWIRVRRDGYASELVSRMRAWEPEP